MCTVHILQEVLSELGREDYCCCREYACGIEEAGLLSSNDKVSSEPLKCICLEKDNICKLKLKRLRC